MTSERKISSESSEKKEVPFKYGDRVKVIGTREELKYLGIEASYEDLTEKESVIRESFLNHATYRISQHFLGVELSFAIPEKHLERI